MGNLDVRNFTQSAEPLGEVGPKQIWPIGDTPACNLLGKCGGFHSIQVDTSFFASRGHRSRSAMAATSFSDLEAWRAPIERPHTTTLKGTITPHLGKKNKSSPSRIPALYGYILDSSQVVVLYLFAYKQY